MCRSPSVLPEGRALQVIRTLTNYMVLIIQLKAVLTSQCWFLSQRPLALAHPLPLPRAGLLSFCSPGQLGWCVCTAGVQLCCVLEASLQACSNVGMSTIPSMHSFLSVHLSVIFYAWHLFCIFHYWFLCASFCNSNEEKLTRAIEPLWKLFSCTVPFTTPTSSADQALHA